MSSATATRTLTRREVLTLATLCFVNVINYVDRFCVTGVLVQIQDAYAIGDDLVGLLQSGFIIAYTIFSPLFGYLGDRYSRRVLLVFSVLFWSGMTIAGSCAPSYVVFFITRGLVGIGETGFTTIAPTVISDTVSSSTRTLLLGIYYLAIPFGAGLGYVLSGQIYQLSGEWRWGLRASPFFGVLGAVLLYFGEYPKRGEKEAAVAGGRPVEGTSYKEDLLYLMKNYSFILMTAGLTCISFIAGVLSWWGPKCLYTGIQKIPENANIEYSTVAFKFGLITMFTGIAGVVTGTMLSKYLRPSLPFIDPVICGAGLLISLPLLVSALFLAAKNQIITFLLIFFAEYGINLNWAVSSDMLFYVVIPTRRGTANALQMLGMHALGDCISPYIVGLCSEYLKKNHGMDDFHALRTSFLLIMAVLLLGGLLFIWNAFYITTDRKSADQMLVLK